MSGSKEGFISNIKKHKQFKLIIAAAAVVAVLMLVVLLKVVQGGESKNTEIATFVAKRGPLTISVLESGTIKSREQIIIKNELEGRTSIISLVAEGTSVKKGDLLVELDASTLQDSKIDQEIMVQNAEAAFINAQENLIVIKNQAESDVNVAELTYEFACEDVNQYIDGQFPNLLTAAINKINLAEETLKRNEDVNDWSGRLFKEKYISKNELQADKLSLSRSRNDLQLAENDRNLLEEFTKPRQIKQLESDKYQAEMALERAKAKGRADVIQAEAALTAKKAEFDRQTIKLAKVKDQIEKATIKAPADGMVIYATTARRGGRDNREPLDEGVEVFERQELIYLPTAASAMAEVDIHEASLDKVQLGLPAIITVDALPGKRFIGKMARISPLPDAQSMWMNPDLKVYQSDIHLEGDDPSLRTGMSCKAEIIAAQYDDAIYIPVQAVIRVAGKPTVFVVKDGNLEERTVEIGLDNNRMIRIISSLEEGELVSLAPPLKSATIEETGSAASGGIGGDSASDSLQQTINKRLEEMNGVSAIKPFNADEDAVVAGQGEGGSGGVSQQQEGQMRQRFQNMSEEERQQMRQRFENMSDEERQKMRQQMQGGGRRQAGSPGQGVGGQRLEGSRQGGGAGSRGGAERNQ